MTISQMLQQSGILTLLGLCVVFSFLIIMIMAMYLLHVVVHACHLDKDLEQKDTSSAANTAPAADNGAIVAAIAAAVREKEAL